MEIEIKQYTHNYLDILYLAARGCYGLEQLTNETIVEKRNFILNLIKNEHESVLEHGIISIQILGCSRSFMSQITRHRLVSFSIKSQHYVNHSNFQVKPIETKSSQVKMIYENTLSIIKDAYKTLINIYGVPIHVAREILPNSCLTNIFMTTNFREWRYIIKLRQTDKNTLEMQHFAHEIRCRFKILIPEVFGDL